MSRIATNLLEEQLTLARRVLSLPSAGGREIAAKDILRLASVTLELHRKLSNGTPFPSAWLAGTLGAAGERAKGS
jgi:hypothetical protein